MTEKEEQPSVKFKERDKERIISLMKEIKEVNNEIDELEKEIKEKGSNKIVESINEKLYEYISCLESSICIEIKEDVKIYNQYSKEINSKYLRHITFQPSESNYNKIYHDYSGTQNTHLNDHVSDLFMLSQITDEVIEALEDRKKEREEEREDKKRATEILEDFLDNLKEVFDDEIAEKVAEEV